MKKHGFKFCIFDITLKEADGVLRICMGLFKRLYIPGAKVNSICYYLRMKYKTTPRIQILKNRLEENIKELGIIIKKTDINLKDYPISRSSRDSIGKYKPDQPRLPQSHDLAAIDLIKKLRNEEVDRIDKSKAIFLTADQRLFDYNYLEMGHKENQTVPEVFVDRLLTNILWLMEPSSDVSLESLIATCSRDVFIKRNVWEIVCKRLEYLHDVKNIEYNDIFSIVYLESIKGLIKDLKIDEIKKSNVDSGNLADKEVKLIKELDERLEKGLKLGVENREKLKNDIKEKDDNLKKLEQDLENKNNFLNQLLTQVELITNQEINKLEFQKSAQKKNCREKHSRLRKRSKQILAILLLFILIAPAAALYIYGTMMNNMKIFNAYIGGIAILSLLGFIWDRTSDNNMLRKYRDSLEFIIYAIIRRNNLGIIISYVREKESEKSTGIDREHIEICNVSGYEQDISNFKIIIGKDKSTYSLKSNLLMNSDEIKNVYMHMGTDTYKDIFIQQGESNIWRSEGIMVILETGDGITVDEIEAPIFKVV